MSDKELREKGGLRWREEKMRYCVVEVKENECP